MLLVDYFIGEALIGSVFLDAFLAKILGVLRLFRVLTRNLPLLLLHPHSLNFLHFFLLLFEELLKLFQVRNEHSPPLKRPLLNDNLRLWEQIKKSLNRLFLSAQEHSPLVLISVVTHPLPAADLDYKV